MSQYQKVAILIFRFLAFVLFGIGLMGAVYSIAGGEDGRGVAAAVWAVAGFALFLGSKPLGRLMTRDLE